MNEEAIISQWNIDEHGNPISVKTEQETQVSVGGNLVQLEGVPDEMQGVTIEDKSGNVFFRVENLDEVYDNYYAYYLMKDGRVKFNPSQNGKLLYFKYYSKGATLLSVSRIYYKDSYDNVVKILEDLIKAGFDALKVLEIFGGAKEVIDRLEQDLDNGKALATQLEDVIAEGTPLQQNLHADITEAKKWKDSLHKDVAEGKILQPQLHQDVIDGRETDANLTQTINSATELDDKIKTTGNASFIIEVDNWIASDDSDWAYMYFLTTSLNSSDLVFKTQEITTKGFEDCLLYSIVKDANTIAFYTDDKVRTKVVVNARQYGGTIQDFSVVNTDLISEGVSNKYVTPQEKVNVGTIPDIKQQVELNKSSLEDIVQLNAKRFGANGDGVTDNKNAFFLISNYVNENPNIKQIFFPEGRYYFTGSTLYFTHEVTLIGEQGTVFDYGGTGDAIVLGKDNLSAIKNGYQFEYKVKEIVFINGKNCTNGIVFKNLVTMPILEDVLFFNFGNSNSWNIRFRGDNWHSTLIKVRFFNDYAENGGNGIYNNESKTNPNCRMKLIACDLSNQYGSTPNAPKLTGVYTGGMLTNFDNCTIEGYAPCVHLGSGSKHTTFENCWFETHSEGNSVIKIGDERNNWINDITFKNCYAGFDKYFIEPFNEQSGFERLYLENITMNRDEDSTTSGEAIKFNILPSKQTGHYAVNCSTNCPTLYTSSDKIDKFLMHDAQLNVPINLSTKVNPLTIHKNDDVPHYIDVKSGATINQETGFRIKGLNNDILYQYAITPQGVVICKSGANTIYAYSSGYLGIGGNPNKTHSLEVFGGIKGNYITVKTLTSDSDSSSIPNSSFYEKTDGNLYFKNKAGIEKKVTS